jgi:hypothetical protein
MANIVAQGVVMKEEFNIIFYFDWGVIVYQPL